MRAELRKLRHLRVSYWLFGLLVAVLTLLDALELLTPEIQSLARHDPDRFVRTMAVAQAEAVAVLIGVVLIVASALLVGGEYSAGTVRVVLARGVGRVQLLAAKLAALAIFGLVVLGLDVLIEIGEWAVVCGVGGGSAGSLPGVLGTALRADAVIGLASLAACVLVAVAAASVGRSATFALGAALAFFPADNMGGVVLDALAGAGSRSLPGQVAGYLLGVNLNALPSKLTGIPGQLLGYPLAADLRHVLIVVGAWCLGLLILSLLLTHRRDVIE